jgi:predicted O-methyltransferase YrrM
MLFEAVNKIVGEVPNMTSKQGKIVYDFIIATDSKRCMELGFASGSGSCFMGAAVQEIGGNLTCIDNQSAKDRRPTAASQLERAALVECVDLVYADRSYTWELMKLIEAQTVDGVCHPYLDFCYIDGAHEWEPDGLSFFLIDKLLKPGGWILFDDLHWTLATSSVSQEDWVQRKSKEEQEAAQVLKVFNLLVRQHPNYGNFREADWWGWAQKTEGQEMSGDVLDEIGVRQSPLTGVKTALRPTVRKIRKVFGD